MDGTLIYGLVVVFAALAILILLIYGTVAKTRWGFTFKQVKCPRCHAAQPWIRRPADAHEGIWGGYTCGQCGTKMDKWGRLRTPA